MNTLIFYFAAVVLAFLASTMPLHVAHSTELSFGCDLALVNPPANMPKPLRIASLGRETFDLRDDIASKKADLIFIDHPSWQNFEVGRAEGYFLAPLEISWTRPIDPNEDFLDTLQSEYREKYTKQVALSQDLVRIEMAPLTREAFHKWFRIYDRDRLSQERGPRLVSPGWAKELHDNLMNYRSLFFYDKLSGDLLGGVIFSSSQENLWAHFEAYKAEAKPLKLEVRAFVELMKYGKANGLQTLFHGPDANFFGRYTPMSTIEFKTSLGMQPANLAWNRLERLVKIVNTDILNRDFVIFERDQRNRLIAHHFTDRPRNLNLHEIRVITHYFSFTRETQTANPE